MLADRAHVVLAITGATAAAIALIVVVESPREHADAAAPHRQVSAEHLATSSEHSDSPTERALAAWAHSCEVLQDGLCVTREPLTSDHCGADGAPTYVVHARSPAEVAAARSQLARVISTYDTSGGDRHDYAMARLALADDELERYLGLAFPTGLDFGPTGGKKDASKQRFEQWIRDKTEGAQRLRNQYDAIAALGDPIATIVALSRDGTIASSFADELATAEIPADVRAGDLAQDKIDAFCDALMTAAEPVEAQGMQAFTTCVDVARGHAHDANVREVVDAARPCLDALERERPDAFPPLDEAFTAPEVARLQMELGVADTADAGTDYDQQNTRGVELRIQRDFAGARIAYTRALALDDTRPEAYFNLGLLETFEATSVDLHPAAAHYQRAAELFTQAGEHASGELRADAMERAGDARKVQRQLYDFSVSQRQ